MSLVKKSATVASGTLDEPHWLHARDVHGGSAFGTGPVADAFNAAFRFPNTFAGSCRRRVQFSLRAAFCQGNREERAWTARAVFPKKCSAFSSRCFCS